MLVGPSLVAQRCVAIYQPGGFRLTSAKPQYSASAAQVLELRADALDPQEGRASSTAGRFRVSFAHPFTAPAVSPAMIRFAATKVKISGGNAISTPAAEILPHSTPVSVM